MPCQSDYPEYDRSHPTTKSQLATIKRQRRELDLVTRLLCALCQETTANLIEEVENGELKAWWENHQKLDAKREAREAKKKRDEEEKRKRAQNKKKLKTQVLSKLSKKEREAIGIRR